MATMSAMSRGAWGMGSAYRRKDGRYVAQHERRGRRTYGYGATELEAIRNLHAKLGTARSPSSSPKTTVGAFLVDWLEVMAPKLGVRTADGYTVIVDRAILPVLGDMELTKLGRRDVEAFVSHWTARRHPRTVAHYLACLRAALSKAVEWGLVPANPATRVSTPRIPEGKVDAFTAADETKFLAHVREDAQYALWLAAFRTGLRQGELLGLRWEDVDLRARVIHVRRTLQRPKGGQYRLALPKTAKSRRTVPIGAALVDALTAYRKGQLEREDKLDQGLVFATPAGGPLPNHQVSRRFAALTDEAGCAHHTMHATRHTFATRLLERGERIDVVQKLLGHSTITTTIDVYGHVTEDAKRAAIERLEGLG